MSTPHEAVQQLRAADQRHQGRTHTPETGEVTAERLAAIEKFAVTIRAWNPTLIPGPLQTTRYAAGAITTTAPALSSTEVQRRAHQRAARVDAFMVRWSQSPTASEAVFVIAEQAVTQPLVHTGAHRAQLRQLLNLSELPKVHLHVMPADRPTPRRLGQCSLYGLEPSAPGQGRGVRVAYLETPVAAWYSTRSEDIGRLHGAFGEMIEAALNPADTRALIREALAP